MQPYGRLRTPHTFRNEYAPTTRHGGAPKCASAKRTLRRFEKRKERTAARREIREEST